MGQATGRPYGQINPFQPSTGETLPDATTWLPECPSLLWLRQCGSVNLQAWMVEAQDAERWGNRAEDTRDYPADQGLPSIVLGSRGVGGGVDFTFLCAGSTRQIAHELVNTKKKSLLTITAQLVPQWLRNGTHSPQAAPTAVCAALRPDLWSANS